MVASQFSRPLRTHPAFGCEARAAPVVTRQRIVGGNGETARPADPATYYAQRRRKHLHVGRLFCGHLARALAATAATAEADVDDRRQRRQRRRWTIREQRHRKSHQRRHNTYFRNRVGRHSCTEYRWFRWCRRWRGRIADYVRRWRLERRSRRRGYGIYARLNAALFRRPAPIPMASRRRALAVPAERAAGRWNFCFCWGNAGWWRGTGSSVLAEQFRKHLYKRIAFKRDLRTIGWWIRW